MSHGLCNELYLCHKVALARPSVYPCFQRSRGNATRIDSRECALITIICQAPFSPSHPLVPVALGLFPGRPGPSSQPTEGSRHLPVGHRVRYALISNRRSS